MAPNLRVLTLVKQRDQNPKWLGKEKWLLDRSRWSSVTHIVFKKPWKWEASWIRRGGGVSRSTICSSLRISDWSLSRGVGNLGIQSGSVKKWKSKSR